MKKIKIISSILVSILIFSGCSMNKSIEVDKATQQKNITKVQNDINEIMGKEYSYIRTNLGTPYISQYYIKSKDYNDISPDELKELSNNLSIQMVYPKDGYESSALYIQINNNKVVGVRTDEFLGQSPSIDSLPSYANNCDVIVDFYERTSPINEDKINNEILSQYNGTKIDSLNKDLSVNNANVIAYTKDNKKIINLYLLKNNKNEINSILTLIEEDKIIKKCKIESGVDVVEDILAELK